MKRSKPASPALEFFAPRDPAALASALAWADQHATADAAEEWYRWGSEATAWAMLRLPAPRVHPRAPELFAAAAGTTATAIAAVLERRAYIDDAGVLRLWPWYPEQAATELPLAERAAAELGIALPGELLDEPYEPAHYLARSGMAAVSAWLRRNGIDAGIAMIDRVPIPPRAAYPREKFEGGMKADARVTQAIAGVLRMVGMFKYASDGASRAHVEDRVDAELARLCSAIGGAAEQPASVESQAIEPAHVDPAAPIGRVSAIYALPRGAVIVCDGALVEIDRTGAFVMAWRLPMGSVFARTDVVVVNNSSVLDLAAGHFVESGELDVVVARMGLEQLPGTAGHDERTEPVISACGRYLLDVDETPYIVRYSDGVTVADGRELERALAEPKPVRAGRLVESSQVDVAAPTIIDGVRFVVRSGQAPVRDGRSLAFALAGGTWRFLVGDAIRVGSKTVARLGIQIASGAFRDDASELWALGSDHAIRVELDGAPRVAVIAPLEPILRSAMHVLASSGETNDA